MRKLRTLAFSGENTYIALRNEENTTSIIVSGIDSQGKDTAEVEVTLSVSQVEDIRNFLVLAVDEYTLTRKNIVGVAAKG